VLGIDAEQLPPNELKNAILKAPVDLLYNGGIGIYAKAGFESHAEVGDRANDAIRIDGREIRARVVAEGGNPGFTQQGRIEAALAGVRLNTDAIDNSAGVDCSDHEVNIKILLDRLVVRGTMDTAQRNELLATMTEEVGQLVLQDNYSQAQCLSVLTRRGDQLIEGQGRLMRTLEAARRLNRAIEFLPSDDQIAERKNAHKGLTAPENAVLMAYTRMWLFDELVASDLPDDEFFASALLAYFPRPLQKKFAAAITSHPLRREIIATVVVNQLVNRTGSTLVHRVQEETGASVADVVRAYVLVRECCGLQALWTQINALDTQVPDAVQGRMLIDLMRFTQRAVLWFLRHRQSESMGLVVAAYAPRIVQLRQQLPALLAWPENAAVAELATQWQAANVPAELAQIVASLELMLPSFDLIEMSTNGAYDLDLAAQVYFTLDHLLNHDWLRQQITALPTGSHGQALARAGLRDDLAWRQRTFTASVLKGASPGATVDDVLTQWQQQHPQQMQRAQRVLADLQAQGQTDLATLSVALRELRNLL
jgi:glutamate dehydrogenase